MDEWMRGPIRQMVEARLLDGQQCAAIGLRAAAVADIWRRFLERPGVIYWTRPWALFALLQWAASNGVTSA
jgi:asparagine synthase (glutamine-hydrolysing)